MPGKENAKKGAKSSSSEGAAIDETSFSEQSRRDLRELFTMIARLQAENNALRATAHLECITERLKEQVEKLESPQPAKEQGNPLSRRLQRLAEIAVDLPLDIKDDDLSVSDLALLCTVLEDDMRRGALISFAGDSVTFPMFRTKTATMETEAGVLDAVDAAAGAMVVAVTMTVDIGKAVHFRVKPLFTQPPILLLFTMDLQLPQDMQPAFNMDNFLRTSLSLPGRHYPRTNSLLKYHGNLETGSQTHSPSRSRSHRYKTRAPAMDRAMTMERDRRVLITLKPRGSTLSADETQGSSMRRSFIDNNELVNDITWHARPETRDSRRRGVALDFRGPSILSYKRQVVIPIDEDMPYVDRSQQPSAPMVLAICGGCKKPGRNIIQCCVKDENGFTTGCGANPSADTSHLFPWTKEYALQALNGENKEEIEQALIWIRNHPETELCEWPTDPTTETWEKVQETYGGDPKNFYKQRSKARETSRRASDH
ncbi:hypothetical protein FOC1_g10014649 [Fusarium oxysporum f. sp. cubense race 1]|uniref:Uncharacterized protein n=1 Tax=Fusarium oxysporum f. sp. cubense (strain race 1) TaxID=1229664 RepID=N4UJ62_FUSC1|nr:hypothetical protein FOC1_g10014649 [Fusarium oxysporum f. sp. cubense race 1]